MTGKKSFQCHKFLPFGNTIFSHQTEKLPFNIKNLQSSLQSHWLLLLALRSDPHRHTTIPALLKGAAASRTLPYLLCYKKKKKVRWMVPGLWAQASQVDVRCSCSSHEICVWQFGQNQAHKRLDGGHFIRLWQCVCMWHLAKAALPHQFLWPEGRSSFWPKALEKCRTSQEPARKYEEKEMGCGYYLITGAQRQNRYSDGTADFVPVSY